MINHIGIQFFINFLQNKAVPWSTNFFLKLVLLEIYEFIFLNIVRVKKPVPEKIHLHLEMRIPHITNTRMTRIQTRDPCTMVKNSSK